MKKLVTIGSCNKCPYFDNEYYTYNETCTLLNRKIEYTDTFNYTYTFPDDCPLQSVDILERVYELCCLHGNFSNGVMDSTGMIDEGDVIANSIIDELKALLFR